MSDEISLFSFYTFPDGAVIFKLCLCDNKHQLGVCFNLSGDLLIIKLLLQDRGVKTPEFWVKLREAPIGLREAPIGDYSQWILHFFQPPYMVIF